MATIKKANAGQDVEKQGTLFTDVRSVNLYNYYKISIAIPQKPEKRATHMTLSYQFSGIHSK